MRSLVPRIGAALALLLLSLGLPWGVVGAERYYVPGWFNPGTCVMLADGYMDCTAGYASPGYHLQGPGAPMAGYAADARVFLIAAGGLILWACYRRGTAAMPGPAVVSGPNVVSGPAAMSRSATVPGEAALNWAIVLISAAILLTGTALRPGTIAALLAVLLLLPVATRKHETSDATRQRVSRRSFRVSPWA